MMDWREINKTSQSFIGQPERGERIRARGYTPIYTPIFWAQISRRKEEK